MVPIHLFIYPWNQKIKRNICYFQNIKLKRIRQGTINIIKLQPILIHHNVLYPFSNSFIKITLANECIKSFHFPRGMAYIPVQVTNFEYSFKIRFGSLTSTTTVGTTYCYMQTVGERKEYRMTCFTIPYFSSKLHFGRLERVTICKGQKESNFK